MAALILAGAAGVGMARTNPGPAEFRDFAADHLTELLTRELCREDGLPMMARLVITDCPGLVASQHAVLGQLAGHHTRRHNFGVLSVYRTEIGGQQLLPSWRLPRYKATTLAAAGRFVLLRAQEDHPLSSETEVSGGAP
ncbi:MAG: DUF4359 domain-containing protein [Synechococcaceae cyanobacterium]|nr:DUF4359 domain-containing protein [Synechococcaceae cyanobacterium]